MIGGMLHTPNHRNVCTFFNFQLTFSQLILHLKMLKLCRVTKVKVFFLVLVYVFNFELFEFSSAILEKSLLTSLPMSPMCGFIAQLVEHRTGICGGHRFESR